MRYYRDLQPGETLQAGDERLNRAGAEWVPVEAVWIGQPVPEDLMGCFRRPVDLPTLQRVTPKAMGELEARHAVSVLVVTEYGARTLNYSHQGFWWRDDWGVHNPVDRPTRGWFIELSTIPEVQQ
jgi:hypothetical protein